MKRYEATYECPPIELYGEVAGGVKGRIEVSELPDDIQDEDWESWLRCQLAAICCIMISDQSYILDDDNSIVTIHEYLMLLNKKYRGKIQSATNRLTYMFGNIN